MIDISRHFTIFDYSKTKSHKIHIIGCGATGSRIAHQLTRLGCDNFVLWDKDIVGPENQPNQLFNYEDIGNQKSEAVKRAMVAINPAVNVETRGHIDEDNISELTKEDSFVFCLVDSMETRKFIFSKCKLNRKVLGFIDTRVGLYSGVVLSIIPQKMESCKTYENFLYTDEEAEAREVSPCGTPITVASTMAQAALLAEDQYKKMINDKKFSTYIEYTVGAPDGVAVQSIEA